MKEIVNKVLSTCGERVNNKSVALIIYLYEKAKQDTHGKARQEKDDEQ